MSITSPLRYLGSKKVVAKELVDLIPLDTDVYIEPFCGSCSVMLEALHSSKFNFKRVICSDINKDLIIFWKYIQDKKYNFISELSNYICNTEPYDIFNKIHSTDKDIALQFMVKIYTCKSGIISQGFDINKYMRLMDILSYNKEINLIKVIDTIQGVEFINESFENVMKISRNIEGKKFYFLDPPYSKEEYKSDIDMYDGFDNIDIDYLLKALPELDSFIFCYSTNLNLQEYNSIHKEMKGLLKKEKRDILL